MDEDQVDIGVWIKEELYKAVKGFEDKWFDDNVLGKGTGEPRGILNSDHRSGPNIDIAGGWLDRGVEWPQTPASADERTMDLPRPVHGWSRSVELHHDRCHDYVLAELLMEDHGASIRSHRSY